MIICGRFPQPGCDAKQEEEEELAENVVQPMTLEAERGGSTRGAMLDPSAQQDPKLRLEIGICGITKADGTEVLEVSHAHIRVSYNLGYRVHLELQCSHRGK